MHVKTSHSTENDWFNVRVDLLRANAKLLPYRKAYKLLPVS